MIIAHSLSKAFRRSASLKNRLPFFFFVHMRGNCEVERCKIRIIKKVIKQLQSNNQCRHLHGHAFSRWKYQEFIFFSLEYFLKRFYDLKRALLSVLFICDSYVSNTMHHNFFWFKKYNYHILHYRSWFSDRGGCIFIFKDTNFVLKIGRHVIVA